VRHIYIYIYIYDISRLRVKNEWSYTPTRPIYIHSMGRHDYMSFSFEAVKWCEVNPVLGCGVNSAGSAVAGCSEYGNET